MKLEKLIRRFLLPSTIISLWYFWRFRCLISTKAEIEFNPNLNIGPDTAIGSFTKIKASDGPLHIGAHVSVSAGCDISSGPGGIFIGDDCLIGAHVNIIGNNYCYDRLDTSIRLQGTCSKGIRIGRNVWIGAGACILDGAIVDDGVIITPNSVVSNHIARNVIAQGNPAKMIFIRR